MKTLLISRSAWAGMLLLSIIVSCKKTDSGEVTPADSGCRVQTESVVTVYKGNPSSSYRTFSYNTKGQLTTVVGSNPGLGSAKTTETYTYDDDGYLIAYKMATPNGTLNDETLNKTYFYANGQLIKEISKTFEYYGNSVSKTIQTSGATTYSYDATGALTQTNWLHTYAQYNDGKLLSSLTSTLIRSYANGMLTSIKETNGGQQGQVYTVENGRVTLETDTDGSKRRYTYNAEGYLIKAEDRNPANVITSTAITEYTSAPLPKSIYPAQKGFPIIPTIYGRGDRFISSYTTKDNLKTTVNQYQSELNDKGYPVKKVATYIWNNQTTTTTFTYANCP